MSRGTLTDADATRVELVDSCAELVVAVTHVFSYLKLQNGLTAQ